MDIKTAAICLAIKNPGTYSTWIKLCNALDVPIWEINGSGAENPMPKFPCALIITDDVRMFETFYALSKKGLDQKNEPYKILLDNDPDTSLPGILKVHPNGSGNNTTIIKMAYESFVYHYDKTHSAEKDSIRYSDFIDLGTKVFFDQFLFGIVVVQDHQIRLLNDKARDLLDIAPDFPAKDLVLWDFIPTGKSDIFQKIMDDIISEKSSAKIFSMSVVTSKKEKLILQAWLSRIGFNKAPALMLFLTDLGELFEARKRGRKYEVEYFRIHKMAMVGKLASGLAHNLNTPVSIIQGNAELLELKYPESREIQMILKQTARLSREIHLLGLRGNKDLSTSEEEIDLNELIRNEMDFLNANLYFKHYVKCQQDLDMELPHIFGLYSDFSQVLSEIIENGIDAMYGLEKRVLIVRTRGKNERVLLSIRDSGKGIDKKSLLHIFNPFYTTKISPDEKTSDPNEPRGTGLGLSMVQSIINKYHGTVKVDSTPGKGTAFEIILPGITSKRNINYDNN